MIKDLHQEDHTKVLMEGRQEGQNRREVWDAARLTLKMEEEAVNQGVQATSGSWKRQTLPESLQQKPALLAL